jgi:D-inositol-3-phosphate glycosyltransferase
MRILFVIENYLPHIGGVEVVFKNLAEGLAARGHEVAIVTHRLKGTKQRERINGVQVYRVNCLRSRYVFTFAAILTVLRLARKADIVHTTTFNAAFPAWLSAKLLGKKCVLTVHEAWVGKWRKYTDMGPVGAWMHELLERLIYLLPFDWYAAVSDSTRKQLLGLGKKKATAVHNAVDYGHFDARKHDGKALRKRHHLKHRYVCLTYGRPGPSKGIEYAVGAVAQIHVPRLKFVFILSRNKQYKAKHLALQRMIAAQGIGERVLFLDPVSHKDLPAYLKMADCVVVPSLSEGFGYTAAEAVAMGTPVVASNTTSLPEVVSGKYVLVPPRDSRAIARAVEQVYRKEHRRSPVRKFLLGKNVNEYVRIYRRLLG